MTLHNKLLPFSLLLFVSFFGCTSNNSSSENVSDSSAVMDESTTAPGEEITEEAGTVPETSSSITRENNESIYELVKRAWSGYCQNPSGNLEFVMDDKFYILSYCEREETEWFRYLLLRDSDGTKSKYDKIIIEPRGGIPEEMEDFYGYPYFTPESVNVLDVDKDGRDELVIGTHITGKGYEDDEVWDDWYYEVYILNDKDGRYSEFITSRFEMPDDMGKNEFSTELEIDQLLRELSGTYNEGLILEDQLHYGKCFGQSIIIEGGENPNMMYYSTMDGYPVELTSYEGKVGTGEHKLKINLSSGSDINNQKFAEFVFKKENGVRMLVQDDETYFVLEEDQENLPINPVECEDDVEMN